ncbi:MAG: hypothetical protein V3V29_07315 [Acidimicrobiia bacterium]
MPELPTDAVRYVMGLGDTEGVLDAVRTAIASGTFQAFRSELAASRASGPGE